MNKFLNPVDAIQKIIVNAYYTEIIIHMKFDAISYDLIKLSGKMQYLDKHFDIGYYLIMN